MSNKINKKKTRPLKAWPLSKCLNYLDRVVLFAGMNPNGFRNYPRPSKRNSNRLANGAKRKKLFMDKVLDKIANEERRI